MPQIGLRLNASLRQEPKTQLGDVVLDLLHIEHPGVTKAYAEAYSGAARVCLSGSHSGKKSVPFRMKRFSTSEQVPGSVKVIKSKWGKPTDEEEAMGMDSNDCTAHGAYAMCLAAVEIVYELFATGRHYNGSGVDFKLVPRSIADAIRNGKMPLLNYDHTRTVSLEVSGTRAESRSALPARLREKFDRAQSHQSQAIAAVCDFKYARLHLKDTGNFNS